MIDITLVNPSRLSKFFEERVVIEKVVPPIVVRLDGVGFSKALKDRPIRDPLVHRALVNGCKNLMKFFNAEYCYIVSDEVNLFMLKKIPYGGRVFKIISISSAILSSSVSLELGRELYFDARVVLLDNLRQAIPYLLYRARIGLNNYVSKLYTVTISKESKRLKDMINDLISKGVEVAMDWRSVGSCLYIDYIDKSGYNPITREYVSVKKRTLSSSDNIDICLTNLLKLIKL